MTSCPPRKYALLLRDSIAAAREAELHYVSLDSPGIRRVKRGRSVVYLRPDGKRVRKANDLQRIASMAIPPAWQKVWICADPDGHIQATGHDARGRKQYRYHARWRKVRDQAKYQSILDFATRLPLLRKALEGDLSSRQLSKRKVVATVVRLMEKTRIRVGNERYVEENGSFGLTTLLDQHATFAGESVLFQFRAKGGKPYRAKVRDRRLAGIVRRCRDIPGQRLFQYEDDQGRFRHITSTDVNDYMKRATGRPFTAKEFRTWAGTVGAACVLAEMPPPRTESEGKKSILRAVELVSKELGNTPAICKKCYVHPSVFDVYRRGELGSLFARCLASARRRPEAGLRPEECAVLSLFERLSRAQQRAAA